MSGRGGEGAGMRALFHVDEPEKWPLALGNAGNLLAYCAERGRPCAVELVANGPAVAALVRGGAGELAPQMESLALRGADFAACRNALRARGIAEEALLAFVRAVPAGVAELVEKQAEGYAYLKP